MKQENSILKNTIALYIRMLFSVCVNIYISRVILDILGVVDFGVYSVVGGIVLLLGFINSSMAGSTTRFLSVAIGEEQNSKLADTYNSAKHLHFGIAILVFLLGETIGLMLVNGYIEVPEERILAANIVYQLSLITVLFTIVQVPFSAMVISMERMDVYAKIEIANVLMKLLVVVLLPFSACDNLILYPFLLLVVALIVYFTYKSYCKKTLNTLRYSNKIRINIIRPMLVYSCWDMLGWGGVSLNTQGRQIFINKFFGVSLNAANGLAATASGAIQAFTNNVIMAFRPRIIKCYAAHNYSDMQCLTEYALMGTMFLMSIVFVPMILCMDYLLRLWLIEVPEYTLVFCRLLLIQQYMEAINTVVKIGIQASGVLRNFTIAGFIIHLSNLVLTFVFYKMGCDAYITYYIAIFLCIIHILINLFYSKQIIPKTNVKNIILICTKGGIVCLGSILSCRFLADIINTTDFLSFIIVFASNLVIITLLSSFIYYGIVKSAVCKILIQYRLIR